MPKFSAGFLFFVVLFALLLWASQSGSHQPEFGLAAMGLLAAVAKGIAMSRPDTKK